MLTCQYLVWDKEKTTTSIGFLSIKGAPQGGLCECGAPATTRFVRPTTRYRKPRCIALCDEHYDFVRNATGDDESDDEASQ